MARDKNQHISAEELLKQALVPIDQQPYQVPANWHWVNLGKTVSIKRGASPRPIKAFVTEDENGVNWIKIGDTGEGKYVDSIREKITWEGAQKSVYVERGTLLLSNSMSFGRPYILNVDGCIHDGWLSINVSECFEKEYMYYALLSSDWYFEQVAVGTAVRNLNSERVAGLPVPLPPLAEQQRIVDRVESLFAKLDQAKELAQNALDSFETRKAAILHKAFTGELTAKWREEHDIGMDSWSTRLLKDTDIQIIDGDRGENYPKKEEFTAEGYCLFLNAKNVTKNGFVFEELQFISKERDSLLRKGRLDKDDIVLTTRGTIGNIAYFDESVPYEHLRINSGMVILRGGVDFFKPFVCWLFRTGYITSQISDISTGSAQPQLPIKIMKELRLPIPNISEQEEIVRILGKLLEKENRTKELVDVIDGIGLMKKAILARAFRGELGSNDRSEGDAMELLKSVVMSQ